MTAPDSVPWNMQMDHTFEDINFYHKIFSPAAFLDFSKEPGYPYVVLVLNSPIHEGNLYEKCCQRAISIIAADAGAGRIYDYSRTRSHMALVNQLRPETIIGDLDSLSEETEQYFRERGTTIIRDDDQYSTDFTKALRHIAKHQDWWLDSFNRKHGRQERELRVLVFGGLGGRADQAFSQIHHLYSAALEPALKRLQLYLLAGESIVFLLLEGANWIDTPLEILTENVGIIPIAKPAVISTQGLEWDVQDWETQFGAQMSTSNHIKAPQVLVGTSERVLFTVEIQPKLYNAD